MFGLKPKPADENAVAEMETLWNNFEKRFLWPQQRREDAMHPAGCTPSTCTHPPTIGVRSRLDEIYQWEDFARANFGTPVGEILWD